MSDFLIHLRPFTTATVIYGLFGYVVPIALAAGWAALGFVALAEREERDGRAVWWGIWILLVPWLGAASYLLAGSSALRPAARRMAVASGGLAVLVVATHFVMTRS
jgi:hypothetical protein